MRQDEQPTPPRGNRSRADAWRRFRRLMWSMLGASVVALGLAYLWMASSGGPLRWQGMIAVGLGVVLSMMVAAALMGLLFFSSATGADNLDGDRDR